jgi:hypothetical protein
MEDPRLQFPFGVIPSSLVPLSMSMDEMLLAVSSRPQYPRGFRRSPKRVRWLRSRTASSGRRTRPKWRGFQANSLACDRRVSRVVIPDCLVSGLLTRQPQVQGRFGLLRSANHAIIAFKCFPPPSCQVSSSSTR